MSEQFRDPPSREPVPPRSYTTPSELLSHEQTIDAKIARLKHHRMVVKDWANEQPGPQLRDELASFERQIFEVETSGWCEPEVQVFCRNLRERINRAIHPHRIRPAHQEPNP
jgi:hypothetical protein